MRLDLGKSDLPEWLVAGMSCAVKMTTYDKKDALLVPAELIQTDEDDDKIKYVMVVAEDDEEPIRREVKLGKTKDKQVEVLSGLKEGDKIVKEEPKKDEDSEGVDYGERMDFILATISTIAGAILVGRHAECRAPNLLGKEVAAEARPFIRWRSKALNFRPRPRQLPTRSSSRSSVALTFCWKLS